MVFVLAFVGAAILSLALTPLVRRAAVRLGAVDLPDHRKIHAVPVPRLGGVAVGAAIALAVLAAFLASPVLPAALFGGVGAARWAALGAASVAILVAGAIDDARGLSARLKFIIECGAAAVVVLVAGAPHAIALGPSTGSIELGAAGAVFAVLWIVTLTNAVNMTDVVDGVAGGIGTISAFSLGVVSFLHGRVVATAVLLGLSGALLGFLPHNFRTPRIFLGDSGSLLVGFLLGAASLVGLGQGGTWLLLPAALALGLPLAECGLTVTRRTLRAVSVRRTTSPREGFVLHRGSPGLFIPDSRHIPHRLLRQGLSQPAALAILYGIAAALGALAFVSVRWPWVGLWGGVVALFGLGYAAAWWWYEELRLLDRGAFLPLFDNRLVHHRAVHALYDAIVTVGSFLLAGALVPGQGAGSVEVGVVAVTTVFGFWLAGLYRGSYLHAGLAEVLRASRAVVVGLVLGAGVTLLGFRSAWPFAGWVLYFYFLLTAVVTGRLLFRLLDHAHQRARQGTRRALIFGAGRGGELALREMLSNPDLGFLPVGFVDDDPRLEKATVYGYPVHGGTEGLEQVLTSLDVDNLIVAIRNLAPARLAEVAAVCRRRGVRVLSFHMQWQAIETAEVGRRVVATGGGEHGS